MTWHLIRLDDISVSPWRNACGTPRELAAWPDSSEWMVHGGDRAQELELRLGGASSRA